MLKTAVLTGLLSLSAQSNAIAAAPISTPVTAVDPAEALGNCLALNTSGRDRLDLAKWIVIGLAGSSQFSDLPKVSGAEQDRVDLAMAGLFVRLLTKDCLSVAKPLLKLTDGKPIERAFEVLGRLAVEEVMRDKSTNDTISGFTKHLKDEDFAPLKD